MAQSAPLDWPVQAKTINFQSRAFIGSSFVNAVSIEVLESRSPIHGWLLSNIASCDSEDVDCTLSFQTSVKGHSHDYANSVRRPNINQGLRSIVQQGRFAAFAQAPCSCSQARVQVGIPYKLTTRLVDLLSVSRTPMGSRVQRWSTSYLFARYDSIESSNSSSQEVWWAGCMLPVIRDLYDLFR